MRDDRNFTSTVYRYKTNKSTGAVTTTSGPLQITRSRRSNASPTTPLGGNYVYPTDYEAFFAFSSTGPSPEGEHTEELWPYTGAKRTFRWTSTGISNASYWYWGCGLASLRPAPSIECLSRARARLLDKIRSSDFNAGQSVAELRESIRTIAQLIRGALNLLKSITRPFKGTSGYETLMRDFRHRSITDFNRDFGSLYGPTGRRVGYGQRRYARWARRTGNAYVSWMYGIRPIILDIFAVLNNIEKGLQEPVLTYHVKELDPNYGLPPSTATRRFKGKVERGVLTEVTYALDDPTRYYLWKYGLTDPLTVAWELVPLSFVVDWFIHLGSFIASIQKPQGLRFQHGYETQFLNNHMVIEERITPDQLLPYIVVTKEAWGTCTQSTRAMHRTRLLNVQTPSPYLDWDLSTGQLTSGLALLLQRI